MLKDIMDGSAYHNLTKEGCFLENDANNLSAIFNTDGVNLLFFKDRIMTNILGYQ